MKNLNYLVDATNEIIATTFFKPDDKFSMEDQAKVFSIACGALGTLAYDEEFYNSLTKVRAFAEEHRKEFQRQTENIDEFFDVFLHREIELFRGSGLSDDTTALLANAIVSIKEQLSKGFDTPENVIRNIEDVQNIICNLAGTKIYLLEKLQTKEALKGITKQAGLVIGGGSIIAINAMAGVHSPILAAFSGVAGGKVMDLGLKHFQRR